MIPIRIQQDRDFVTILGETHRGAIRELRDAIRDIADRIEVEARRRAPEDTGELKGHPTDRDEQRGVITDIPLFGGGTAIRGAGGLFIPGKAFGGEGKTVIHIDISVARIPEHAKWVHNGTGLYGPRRTPIVPRSAPYLKFTIDGRTYRRKSVRGQRPQPYLFEAYLYVNNSYVPSRVGLLKSELRG